MNDVQVGDDAANGAAVGLVSGENATDGIARQLQPGFLAQFAQAGVAQVFVRIEKAARQGEQAVSRLAAAFDDEDVFAAKDERIDGDEDGRVGRGRPGLLVVCDIARLGGDGAVGVCRAEIAQGGGDGGRQLRFIPGFAVR